MSRAEDVYIFQLLEPDSVIITGNAKRYKPQRRVVQVSKPMEKLTREEDERRQDEYLKSKGII